MAFLEWKNFLDFWARFVRVNGQTDSLMKHHVDVLSSGDARQENCVIPIPPTVIAGGVMCAAREKSTMQPRVDAAATANEIVW